LTATSVPATGAHVDSEHAQQRVLDTVRQLAGELHPQSLRIPTLGAGDSLERDYGLDSLARVELVVRLERAFDLRLPEGAFAEPDTPADLLRVLRQAQATAGSGPGPGPGHGPAPVAAQTPLGPQATCEPLPETVDTLIGALQWHARTHAARTHVLLYGEHEVAQPVSYGELHARALSVAGGLAAHCGVQPDDRVAIMLPTGEGFLTAFYGTLYAGAVPVPLYPPARLSQLEDHLRRVAGIVANAGATVLVTVPEARSMSALLRPLAPSLHRIVEIATLQATGPAWPAPATRGPGDIAFLQYTSGSTGQPKGVVLTHANLLANLRGMRDACRAEPSDLFVSWLPLYHDMGLIGACLGTMAFGFTLVLTSPFAFLGRPARWLWLLHRHRATITAGPNFAYELCVNKVRDEDIRGLDLSALRLAFNGAEAVSPDTLHRFHERFARYGLRREAMTPVYGLAECSLGLTFPPLARGPLIDVVERDALLARGAALRVADPGVRAVATGDATATSGAAGDIDAHPPIRLVSSGRVLPGHGIRIVSRDGAELPERTQGEIEFRGPSATGGYHGNPQATRQLFHGEWLRTGDLGYLADGELFVTGRSKDIIIRGGHNIHPQELEEAAARVPGVRKGGVAVFPARDASQGTERLIVLAETTETDPAERQRIVTEIGHLAVDLIGLPADEVVLAPPRAVLKTSSGKIRRAACRERFEQGTLGETSRPPWQQMLRLAAAGTLAWVRRALRRVADTVWTAWASLTLVLVAAAGAAAILASRDVGGARAVARAGARTMLRLWGALPRVDGDPTRVRERACIVVPNHSSYLDGLVLSATLPPCLAFVAKQELAPQRVAGTLLRRLGTVFVERADPLRSAEDARAIAACLARGEPVVVFAEGTFREEPGMLPFHMGAFLTAASRRVPVVPVAILGTRRMMPGTPRPPRPASLRVVIGEPIDATGDDWQAALALRARTRAWLLSQTGEPDREV